MSTKEGRDQFKEILREVEVRVLERRLRARENALTWVRGHVVDHPDE